MATVEVASRLLPAARHVPLAWRNLVSNKRRLLRSSAGIAFAVLLMMVQLGFERAFFDVSLALVRAIDGELVIMNAAKYRFANSDPFAHRLLDTARGVPGVASAAPLYIDWQNFFWKSPKDGDLHLVQVWAFDPDRPVLTFADINDKRELLKLDDAVLVDRRARPVLGMGGTESESEINGRKVQIAGRFALGPDFMSDGTIVMSDKNFARLLPGNREAANALPVEAGIIKLRPGEDPAAARQALRAALPASLAVMTKPELIEFERHFQADLSAAGPIFWLGTVVGFVVGMLISYQIIYTDLSDQLPQYATLKGIGYGTGYIARVVFGQAALSALAGYIPAWLLCLLVYKAIGELALLPLHITLGLTLLSLGLTVAMCLVSAALALRRVIAADPAEVF